MTDAKQAFKARVQEWAKKLDVKVAWLGVRPMRNKWASCATNGQLNFSTELLGLDRNLWDYVIVHELLHFSVPNHGKLWKSLMRAYLGDDESLENALKAEATKRLAQRKKTGREPARLKAGKVFHKKIQAEWEREAAGEISAEQGITKLSGRKGRIDVFADGGETKGLVEIKNTDWDRMTDQAVRRNVRRQIKQVWDYIDPQPNEADGVCPGIIFPKRPNDPERLKWIEDTFYEDGIAVVWHDETIQECRDQDFRQSNI